MTNYQPRRSLPHVPHVISDQDYDYKHVHHHYHHNGNVINSSQNYTNTTPWYSTKSRNQCSNTHTSYYSSNMNQPVHISTHLNHSTGLSSPSAAVGVSMNQPPISNLNYAYDIESSPATSGFISSNTAAKHKNSQYGRSSLKMTDINQRSNFQNMTIQPSQNEKKNKISLPSLRKGLRLFNLRKSSDESSRNEKKLSKKKSQTMNSLNATESKIRSYVDQQNSYMRSQVTHEKVNNTFHDFEHIENVPPRYDTQNNINNEEFMDYTAVMPPAPKVFKTRSKKKVEKIIHEHQQMRNKQQNEDAPRADPVAQHCHQNHFNNIEFQDDKDIYQKSIHKVQQWLISIPDDMTRFSV